MSRSNRWIPLLLLLVMSAGERLLCDEPTSDMVRDDWYFRESLAAIRDWEAILQRHKEIVPRLPVPVNGSWLQWPNPIPTRLMPAEDQGRRVRVGMKTGHVELEENAKGDWTTLASGNADDVFVAYQHPGGGGKDQWYHVYTREFDRLTTIQSVPAPFVIRLEGAADFTRGPNELVAWLTPVGSQPVELSLRLDLHSPDDSLSCGQQTIRLGPGEEQVVRLPVPLDEPGGRLLELRIEAAGQSYRLPILTHVEDVATLLSGVEQTLLDSPNKAASERLAKLRERLDDQTAWRSLFEDACRLRDDVLLARADFDTLLFVKRKPYFSEQPFMDAHHLFNRPGGGIYRLTPPRPEGVVTPVVESLGEGVYRDVRLHWNAERFLFSFGNGSDKWDGSQSYHLYESNVDGARLRQLTEGPKNDCEPFYLPSGQIGFTSDRSEHYVMCGGDRHSPTLFVMEADGAAPRQLSFNVFNDFTPSMLPDGRILYSRWEYNERSVTSLHNPFTMAPDGTMVSPYYGNATSRPNVIMFPRAVPGSHRVMALFTAHHGQTHGAVGLIDVRQGPDGPEPLQMLTPNVPVSGEAPEDSRWGWYSDPTPLSETTFLCSYTPTVVPWHERSWAVYVADRHGNLALVVRDPEISCAEPVPLVIGSVPHAMPPATLHGDSLQAEATLALSDVYVGLPQIERGDVRFLRVLEDVPRKSVPTGGVIITSGTSIYTIKRIHGLVPVEPDGSAHFIVPANRNVYFEALDADGREIQRMRSVVCLKPGERRGCIGCHERRWMAPPARQPAAFGRGPDRPQPPPWGTATLSFLRDVQPLLNAKCAVCHTYDRYSANVVLTDDLTDQFTVAYEELLPYLSVANSMRWDNPDDVRARAPYTYGSRTSPLMRILDEGHHDVELTDEETSRLATWIDANAVYYDRYEQNWGPKRRIFVGSVRNKLEAVFSRRCGACHGRNEGRFDSWWLSVHRRDLAQSRMLAAPLSREAGGWGRCDETVFADKNDPDYVAMATALRSLEQALGQRPRADLLSIRGTEAERQVVGVPPPPPPRPASDRPTLEGDWDYLSDLTWESAASGWTPNQDGLPRLDLDVQESRLRLGARPARKGIGTHAPSEIVYQLDGRYREFHATVTGAEAGGTVVFQVFGDGKRLAESGVMRGLQGTKSFDVSVAGVRRLRLVVTDAGDGYNSDMANWVEARVRKSEEDR